MLDKTPPTELEQALAIGLGDYTLDFRTESREEVKASLLQPGIMDSNNFVWTKLMMAMTGQEPDQRQWSGLYRGAVEKISCVRILGDNAWAGAYLMVMTGPSLRRESRSKAGVLYEAQFLRSTGRQQLSGTTLEGKSLIETGVTSGIYPVFRRGPQPAIKGISNAKSGSPFIDIRDEVTKQRIWFPLTKFAWDNIVGQGICDAFKEVEEWRSKGCAFGKGFYHDKRTFTSQP